MATTFKRTVRYYGIKNPSTAKPSKEAIQVAKRSVVEVDFDLPSSYRGAYGTTILYKVPGFCDEIKVQSLTIDIATGDGVIKLVDHDHWYGTATEEIKRLIKVGWKITGKRSVK